MGHTNLAGIPPDPRDLPRGVDRAIKVPVEQHQFDAAVSFHFNTGGIGRVTWVRRLNAGNRRGAAAAIMNWRRPPEIIQRRRKEQTLFRDGTYTSGGYATVFRANRRARVIWSSGKRTNVLALLGKDQTGLPITAILRPGSIGADVRRLQEKLGIIADGVFGPITKAALIAHQTEHDLLADGIAGPLTLASLGLA